MATRKKHIRTPYEDERKKHRAAASRHVLALEAQIKEDDKRKLFHIANDLRVYGNHLKAVFLLSETENVWAAVQSVLYKSGKHLNYAKRGELPLIRAKQIERGITLSFVDGVPRCKMGAIDDFALIVKKNDSFTKNELACIEAFVSDLETEKKAVAIFSKTGIPQNTYRPCFVALK